MVMRLCRNGVYPCGQGRTGVRHCMRVVRLWGRPPSGEEVAGGEGDGEEVEGDDGVEVAVVGPYAAVATPQGVDGDEYQCGDGDAPGSPAPGHEEQLVERVAKPGVHERRGGGEVDCHESEGAQACDAAQGGAGDAPHRGVVLKL